MKGYSKKHFNTQLNISKYLLYLDNIDKNLYKVELESFVNRYDNSKNKMKHRYYFILGYLFECNKCYRNAYKNYMLCYVLSYNIDPIMKGTSLNYLIYLRRNNLH